MEQGEDGHSEREKRDQDLCRRQTLSQQMLMPKQKCTMIMREIGRITWGKRSRRTRSYIFCKPNVWATSTAETKQRQPVKLVKTRKKSEKIQSEMEICFTRVQKYCVPGQRTLPSSPYILPSRRVGEGTFSNLNTRLLMTFHHLQARVLEFSCNIDGTNVCALLIPLTVLRGALLPALGPWRLLASPS